MKFCQRRLLSGDSVYQPGGGSITPPALNKGSVMTAASSYTLADDVLTFYFAPNQWPGQIRYDVYGYLPGRYRALPASIKKTVCRVKSVPASCDMLRPAASRACLTSEGSTSMPGRRPRDLV